MKICFCGFRPSGNINTLKAQGTHDQVIGPHLSATSHQPLPPVHTAIYSQPSFLSQTATVVGWGPPYP